MKFRIAVVNVRKYCLEIAKQIVDTQFQKFVLNGKLRMA